MDKELLIELRDNIKLLSDKKVELNNLQEQFNRDNIELIEQVNQLSMSIDDSKSIIKEQAENEYMVDGNKKRLGGVSIRINKDVQYDDDQALSWAKEHNLCLQLNKVEFKKLAKTTNIDFVRIEDKITVCFPAKIKFDGDEE